MPAPGPFASAHAVAHYREGPPRQVPRFAELLAGTHDALAGGADADASILVVGAGGGLEIEALAARQTGWRFVGVDPSQPMLDLASEHLGSIADRIELLCGTVHDAPPGPFAGATCLLTMHFIPAEEKVATLRGIRERLAPGARLVIAHHSADPETNEGRAALAASVAHATGLAPESDEVQQRVAQMTERLALQSPAADHAALLAAGFTAAEEFWSAHSFRGWIASG